MATDFLSKFETHSLPGGRLVQCKASGAVTLNDVVLLLTAAEADKLVPVVKASDDNDSVLVYGVAYETKADGEYVLIKKGGLAKVKITCSTVAIVVGDALASDNGHGAKEAASATAGLTHLGKALQASSVQNDEILIDMDIP